MGIIAVWAETTSVKMDGITTVGDVLSTFFFCLNEKKYLSTGLYLVICISRTKVSTNLNMQITSSIR